MKRERHSEQFLNLIQDNSESKNKVHMNKDMQKLDEMLKQVQHDEVWAL